MSEIMSSTPDPPTEQQQPSTLHRSPPKVFEAWDKHEYTFFILHGRGDHPSNFAPLLLCSPTSSSSGAKEPDDLSFQHVLRNTKLVFLSAEIVSSFREGGRQWFKLSTIKDPNKHLLKQIPGLTQHVETIQQMIKTEVDAGIPHERIVLMGLSQGCAQSLFALLTMSLPRGKRLGAVVGMSGWLPFEEILNGMLDELTESEAVGAVGKEHAGKVLQGLCKMADLPSLPDDGDTHVFDTPVFLGHGTADDKVHVKLGGTARDTLQRLGFAVEWFPYEGFGHWWKAPEEIDDILAFLQRHIGLQVESAKPPPGYRWS